jgi:microsomal dipeptidase-like Zn-dependent dipeptidase
VLYPVFIDPSNATIARVADHVEYIASKISRKNVGLASDFDGMGATVEGMEDASKWPYLVNVFPSPLTHQSTLYSVSFYFYFCECGSS